MNITIFKTFVSNLQKKHLWLAFLLFTIVFLFSYLPYFIYIPIPNIGWDTYDYFWMAEKFYKFDVPLLTIQADLPVGYPLFITLCKLLSMNIIQIIFIQALLFYLACVYLIFQISGFLKNASIAVSISLCLYILQPLIMKNTTALYPDSLYGTSLIFVVGSICRFFHKDNSISFLLILLGLFFSILIRSNGIFIYYIPIVIIIWAIIKKRNIKFFLISFTLMLLLLSTINLVTKNYFFPGDMHRISLIYKKIKLNIFKNELEPKTQNLSKSKNNKTIINVSPDGTCTFLIVDTTSTGRPINQIRYTQPKIVMYKEYAQLFTRTKPSFYYSLMKSTYNSIITNKQLLKDSVLFDGYYYIDDFAPTLKNFMYKNYNYSIFDDKKHADVIDYYNSNRNYAMLFTHYFYQLTDKLKINYAIFITFWLILIFSIYKVFSKKSTKKIYLFLILTSSVYLVHFLFLPIIHDRVQERYLFVTEFIIYLNAFVAITLLFTEVKSKLSNY